MSEKESEVVKVRTCGWSPPGDHPVGCGMYLTIKDNKIVYVEGDPEHPVTGGRLCSRCLVIAECTHHPDKLRTCLKRAREDRGKDKWTAITWDEALDIIEEQVTRIKANWGAESIFVAIGTGREATLYASPMAFAVLQTPNYGTTLSGCSCYGPRCAVSDYMLGAGYPELDYAAFFPDRYDDPRYEIPKYIILWGKYPLTSNPDGFFGHAIIDLMKRGSQIISVDPRITWLSVRSAYHLQLRPGTDAALALGMLNVIINEDLIDHDFVEKWCYGFDKLKERVQEYPPEKVSEITWVPKDVLIEASRAFANNKPSSIMWGLALDTQKNGVQAGQGVLSLIAITGNYDIPGGVTLAVPASFMGKWRWETNQYVDPELFDKRLINPEHGAYNAARLFSCHPDVLLDTLESGKPYPLKMGWFIGTNMYSCITVQPQRWYNALKDLEFNVVQDIFMTPTAQGVCDLVLPVSSFPEHDGIVLPHFGRNTHFLGAINKALTDGEGKSDLEIDFIVGKRLNPKAWPWETASQFFTEQIKPQLGITFEELCECSTVQQPFEYYKYEKGMLRPDKQPGFNTPTGLIELRSTMYAMWGEDPLPYFEEPTYSPVSQPELSKEYPYVLTTGARPYTYFHSEHRQIPSLRQINPEPIVQLHPKAAETHGITDGDWIQIENMFGSCVMKAEITKVVPEKLIHAQHAWWFPEESPEAGNPAESEGLFGTWCSNVNNLIPHYDVGKLGYGAPYKNVICTISKAENPHKVHLDLNKWK